MPKTNYNDPSFWQEKYKTTCCQSYQWICKPQDVFKELSAHLDYDSMDKVLEIGCGTSSFCKKLKIQTDARQKTVQFTCVDFSKQLIKMSKKSKVGLQSATYICTDIRDLKPLNQQQFDYIFDKGCLDCVFCYDNFIKQVLKSLIECYKVLKVGGKLVILSHGKPKHRVYLIRNKLIPFHVQYQILPKTRNRQTQVYAYICTKKESNQQEEGKVLSEGQKSDDQKEQQKKKPQQDNKKKNRQQNKKNKQDAIFILDENKKKNVNVKKSDEAQFILDDETDKSPKKIKKDKDQANFILSGKKNEGNFILDQNNQNASQQKDNEQQNQNDQEQKEQRENQVQEQQNQDKKEEKQKEEAPFILKQAQYQNDFDQV